MRERTRFPLCTDTAYAKNYLSKKWYKFDDSLVSVLDSEESIVVSLCFSARGFRFQAGQITRCYLVIASVWCAFLLVPHSPSVVPYSCLCSRETARLRQAPLVCILQHRQTLLTFSSTKRAIRLKRRRHRRSCLLMRTI